MIWRKGDPKLYVGSIYGTKVFDDGQYVDIVGKMGRAENDYTVYNAEGRKLDGDYHATGYGLSMEYGKRFGTAAGYVEPQIQLLFSRLGSADYDAVSDFDGDKKMHVHQDSMSSFIGRLGIAAGRATEKGNLYAKASILHEFKGDTAATFSAEGEDTSRVEQDFGDTWAELTLGGVYRLNGSNLFYANVTRGFGGDYKMEWKVNAGLRLLSNRRKWFWAAGMLCMSLAWNGVQAEDSMKGQPAPILEMGVKPKATPQELEQMRWMEIFANDIALYRFDVQSIRQNETDPDEVQMTVQAVYTDKKFRSR